MEKTPERAPPRADDRLDAWLEEHDAALIWWTKLPDPSHKHLCCYRVGDGALLIERDPRGGWEAWLPASDSTLIDDNFRAMERALGLSGAPARRPYSPPAIEPTSAAERLALLRNALQPVRAFLDLAVAVVGPVVDEAPTRPAKARATPDTCPDTCRHGVERDAPCTDCTAEAIYEDSREQTEEE